RRKRAGRGVWPRPAFLVRAIPATRLDRVAEALRGDPARSEALSRLPLRRLDEVADDLPLPVLELEDRHLPRVWQVGERARVQQHHVLARRGVGQLGGVPRVLELAALERAELGRDGRALLRPLL